jgi:hypothetical protein
VEEGIFDKVEVYFLIVGHTHGSIDQYFSVLSSRIYSSDFICSPLALQHLFATIDDESVNPTGKSWVRRGKTTEKSVPLGVHKLSLIFDTKEALKPLINMNIKYYSIPHCFLFHKFGGIAIMQYSIYSSGQWLPRMPETMTEMNISQQLSIKLQHFDLVGGEQRFLVECGAENSGQTGHSVLSHQHQKAVAVLSTLSDLADALKGLEIEVVKTAVEETDEYEHSLLDELHKSKEAQLLLKEHEDELRTEIARHVLKHNTAKCGFIAWLKPHVSRRLDPEPLNLLPALRYLMDNEEYESTGHDIYDLFGQDVDVQYSKIMDLLFAPNTAAYDKSVCLLSLPAFSTLKELYRDKLLTVDYTAFVKAALPMISTAQMVIQDVMDRRIKTSNNYDFNFKQFVLSRQEIVYYYHRLTVKGICLTLL